MMLFFSIEFNFTTILFLYTFLQIYCSFVKMCVPSISDYKNLLVKCCICPFNILCAMLVNDVCIGCVFFNKVWYCNNRT